METSLEWIIGYVAENNASAIGIWQKTIGAVTLEVVPSPPKTPDRSGVIMFGWPVSAPNGGRGLLLFAAGNDER